MWFKSIEKDQFVIFVQQKTRLNKAYWMATKALYFYEQDQDASDLTRIIKSLDIKSAINMELVKAQLESQKAITKDLTTLELLYVEWYCNNTLSKISVLKGFRKIEKYISSSDEIVARESQFIRDYSNKIPEDDLESEWNRGIYLIYQCSSIAEKGNIKTEQWTDIKKRIAAAAKIMSPSFNDIKDYCEAFAGHLELEPSAELALSNQLFFDLSKQFWLGRNLVGLIRRLLKLMEITDSWRDNNEQAENFIQKICTKIEYCHFHMIEANLARSNHINEVIDASHEQTRHIEGSATLKFERPARSDYLRSFIDK
jgi:hypothetical protein